MDEGSGIENVQILGNVGRENVETQRASREEATLRGDIDKRG